MLRLLWLLCMIFYLGLPNISERKIDILDSPVAALPSRAALIGKQLVKLILSLVDLNIIRPIEEALH